MKLAMIRIIAHHTSGEAKPLIPVHDHALSRSEVSVAPRFKRSSDTSTLATLNASCSQGLPKPEGRTCICFFTLPASHRNRFWFVKEWPLSKLIGVWKSPQEPTMACWSKIFDHPAKNWIQKGVRVHDVQVERHELAAEV